MTTEMRQRVRAMLLQKLDDSNAAFIDSVVRRGALTRAEAERLIAESRYSFAMQIEDELDKLEERVAD